MKILIFKNEGLQMFNEKSEVNEKSETRTNRY